MQFSSLLSLLSGEPCWVRVWLARLPWVIDTQLTGHITVTIAISITLNNNSRNRETAIGKMTLQHYHHHLSLPNTACPGRRRSRPAVIRKDEEEEEPWMADHLTPRSGAPRAAYLLFERRAISCRLQEKKRGPRKWALLVPTFRQPLARPTGKLAHTCLTLSRFSCGT